MLKPGWLNCNIAILYSFTCMVSTAFYLNYSVILVVSIRKRVLMGFLPWILFRGFITFGLLILGTVFTINDLKGNSIGSLFSSQSQEGNKGNNDIIWDNFNYDYEKIIPFCFMQINTFFTLRWFQEDWYSINKLY